MYEKNPTMAKSLFDPSCARTTVDVLSIPSCDASDQIKKIDGLAEYTDQLSFLYGSASHGSFCGTLYNIQMRAQDSAILQAVYDTSAVTQTSQNAPNSPDISTEIPKLQHFSRQGLWEKLQYEKFLTLKEKAQKGLAKYYMDSKHLSAQDANRLAAQNVVNLANEYVSSHYSSYDDWNLNLLDDFLKLGTLPDNSHFEYDIVLHLGNGTNKDQAKPDILAYFLKLAIVNDYSQQDIEKIIAAGPNLQDPKLKDNALMNAVKRPEILQLLLEKGANVNAQNDFGKTALMYAIQYGNLDAVKLLVNHKADVNLATFEKPEDDCTYSVDAGKRTPLMYAAWHSNDEMVKYLLAKGADPNAKDTKGHDYKFYLGMNDFQKNS